MSSELSILQEQDIPNSFAITCLQNSKTERTIPLRLKYNQILFIERGSGSLQIDDRSFSISGNEIFLLAKEQVLQIQIGTIISGYRLCFDDFFWEKAPASASNCKSILFDNAAINQTLPLTKSYFDDIYPIFQLLNLEFKKTDYINKPDALAAFVKILMIKMANFNAALADGYNSYEYQDYRKFYDLITKDFMLSHEVDYYADQLNIPARKLTLLCKRYSGKGAKELIKRQLMTEAKRSLQFSANPVKEIAYRLKFLSAEQFSHFFKKEMSVSPRHYRSNSVNFSM
jgi:AraC family transcriptional activator of pobA